MTTNAAIDSETAPGMRRNSSAGESRGRLYRRKAAKMGSAMNG
jgi:hypothetical protein